MIHLDRRYGRITSSYAIYYLYRRSKRLMLRYGEYQEITFRIGLLLHHKGMKPQQRYVSIFTFVRHQRLQEYLYREPYFWFQRCTPACPWHWSADPDGLRSAGRRSPPSRVDTQASSLGSSLRSSEAHLGPRKLDAARIGHKGSRRWLPGEGRYSAASA